MGAEHRKALHGFVEEHADVFIQNRRPEFADRLGFGAESMLNRTPRLIHCSIGGSPAGTKSFQKPGYNMILQAFSGILDITGEADRDPVRLGISAVDQVSGLWAAIAILNALLKRQVAGRGSVVRTSLFEASVYLMSAQIGQFQFTGTVPQRWGTRLKEFVPMRVYPTTDGRIALAAATDKLFRAFSRALELPSLAEDERYASARARERNRVELDMLIERELKRNSNSHWLSHFERFGIPVSAVNSVKT